MKNESDQEAIHLYPDVWFHWYPSAVDISPGIDCSWCGLSINADDHAPLIFHQMPRERVACVHLDCLREVSPDGSPLDEDVGFVWVWLRWGDWRGIPVFAEQTWDICE